MKTSASQSMSISDLKKTAGEIRKDIIRMTAAAGSGHPGGSLSATEIVTALYFSIMQHDPKNTSWPDRDRLILSKGHTSPLLYAALAEAGSFEVKMLPTFRKLGSPLQGHPDRRRLPGVEASTGSLGQGLSIAIGHALARRLDQKDYFTYVVMSDGETNEGQTWEAIAMAAHHKVDHLIVYLDYNKFQLDDATSVICNMESLEQKWRSFNWQVQEMDGHDLDQVLSAVKSARQIKEQPAVIVAHTIKGKGVSFMENNNNFHGVAPNQEERERALKELS